MSASQPPPFATWLLQHWGSGPQREALAGDLVEQLNRGRSKAWYQRQVFKAILVGAVHDMRQQTLVAGRAFVIGFGAWLFVGWVTSALRQSLSGWWTTNPWGRWEMLRQFWAWYGVPFVVIDGLAFCALGWLIARWHRRHRAAMVILCAVSHLPSAIQWVWRTGHLLQAGLWPFWDYRVAVMFQGACLCFVFPACVLLGGLWEARSDADRIPFAHS